MDNNKSKLRCKIIKSSLQEERCGKLYENMTTEQISQLCSMFKVSKNEIIGYYEDVMNLGKTILASARKKLVNQGLLFLKDSFIYRKKSFKKATKVFYDDIKLVEKGSFGTKVHYNNNGTPTTLILRGISYADSNEVIPNLLIRLRDLSSMKSAKTATQEKKDNKAQEKQANIDKWNEHIRKCAQTNRIAQIKHLEDYLQFPSFDHSIVMAKWVCKEFDDGTNIKRKTYIVWYDKYEIQCDCFSFPIDKEEVARVFFKIVPFFIKTDDNNKDWWLKREKWNYGSNYDCDDSYNGKIYFFAGKQEDYDTNIKTENDVFIQKQEIEYLPDQALLYLADIIKNWRDNNYAEIVGNYDLWKSKRDFIVDYEDIINEEIEKRGLVRFDEDYKLDDKDYELFDENYELDDENYELFDEDYKLDDDDASEHFTNYGAKGEQNVEYALKWLPKEYRAIQRTEYEGIRLRNTFISNETQEIDHIVVAPNGVFLIETKYLKGNIIIDNNGNWSRYVEENLEGIKNPIQQIDRHYTLVSSILNGFIDKEDIHNIICLAYDTCTINGIENSPVAVVKSDLLARHIINCESKKKYNEDDIEAIIEKIEQYRI